MLSLQRLDNENHRFKNSRGISQENYCAGFLPAFRDARTGSIYRSCFVDGRPAPVHVLDGLPAELVLRRNTRNRVEAVKGSITAGFMLKGKPVHKGVAIYDRNERKSGNFSELRGSRLQNISFTAKSTLAR